MIVISKYFNTIISCLPKNTSNLILKEFEQVKYLALANQNTYKCFYTRRDINYLYDYYTTPCLYLFKKLSATLYDYNFRSLLKQILNCHSSTGNICITVDLYSINQDILYDMLASSLKRKEIISLYKKSYIKRPKQDSIKALQRMPYLTEALILSLFYDYYQNNAIPILSYNKTLRILFSSIDYMNKISASISKLNITHTIETYKASTLNYNYYSLKVLNNYVYVDFNKDYLNYLNNVVKNLYLTLIKQIELKGMKSNINYADIFIQNIIRSLIYNVKSFNLDDFYIATQLDNINTYNNVNTFLSLIDKYLYKLQKLNTNEKTFSTTENISNLVTSYVKLHRKDDFTKYIILANYL